jgi:hypothetical protein
VTASVRRRHLKAKFDPNAPPANMLPRRDYGIGFYGAYNGEIMVTVDLFTRETTLTHLNKRTQDNIAQALLKHVIFQRGVPRTLRIDNAPELSSLTGAVSAICEYLKISQIRTGGHNPRGNSICIGTRSMVIRYQGKDFQRDAGMVMLEKPRFVGEDPTIANRLIIGPQLNSEASRRICYNERRPKGGHMVLCGG